MTIPQRQFTQAEKKLCRTCKWDDSHRWNYCHWGCTKPEDPNVDPSLLLNYTIDPEDSDDK